MIELDGSLYSGSGTIVRQAIALSALTGEPVHIVKARSRRAKPGLQPQHVRVVEAIRELVQGKMEGVRPGSKELRFWPGDRNPGTGAYRWDIGSAGSTTLLALAVLPVMGFQREPLEAELQGGIFQDFAPSFFHLRDVVLPLLCRFGLEASIEMRRPGYVPRGGGVLSLTTLPLRGCLHPVVNEGPEIVESVTGIALASHLERRAVARRMADAAREVMRANGYETRLETIEDTSAHQPGAAFVLFANLAGAWRLGADWAGAFGRPAELIGKRVAAQLLEEVKSGAILDCHAADQIIPFAALADGESRLRIRGSNEHIESNAWLVREFLGAKVDVSAGILSIHGVGFRPGSGR